MGVKKKIGIKYCGGCNPTYERVEMIQRVQSLLEDRFLFLRHDQQGLNVLVLVNGCPRACSGKNLNQTGVPSLMITGENDSEAVVGWLTALDKNGDF